MKTESKTTRYRIESSVAADAVDEWVRWDGPLSVGGTNKNVVTARAAILHVRNPHLKFRLVATTEKTTYKRTEKVIRL